jgi:hypothetical protein
VNLRPLIRSAAIGHAAVAAGLLAAATPDRAAAVQASPGVYTRGEQVLRHFCLSCHGSPGGKVEDPLGPRLRPEVWGDPEQAYLNIGQLWSINRRMDQPFRGTDSDRRALSLWLSRRARQNIVSPWKAAAPWLAAAATSLAAGLLFLRLRGRAGSRRSTV